MNNVAHLNVRMKAEARSSWNFLLQKGFFLLGVSGMTVREFLREAVGYDDCLIDETVRTIFLNSSPVDDIDTTHVKDGDRMALGSAMPGLVGICMGRDNPYKEFRSDIASVADNAKRGNDPVRLFIKIFSTLAVDTGTGVLSRGIEMDAGLLVEYFEKDLSRVLAVEDVAAESLLDFLKEQAGEVLIKVNFD